jgi:beta-glucosidase
MIDNSAQAGTLEHSRLEAYKDPSRSVEERVHDLLGRMTLEEKVAQMLCIWHQKKEHLLDECGRPDPDRIRRQLPHGVGQIARLSDTNGGLTARETAEYANAIQETFVKSTRLGIPVMFHEECLHGLAGKEATSFPQPIGLGATFDPELVEEIYATIASDARTRGVHQALTPVIDVTRDPRWGRVEETFGEDPFLVGTMGLAAVKGFQGDGTFRAKDRIVATLKHFAAHGQPEAGMNCGPVNVSERELRDVFLAPFRKAVLEGGALSVMASYNEIDGVPSTANTWLLNDVLRGEWGFRGLVVSDYYSIAELDRRDETSSHSVAADKRDASLLAVKAGISLETPDPDCYPLLVRMVREGQMQESKLDPLVASLLQLKFRLGLFDDPYVDVSAIDSQSRLERERGLALRAAKETVTLLKNDGHMLPLRLQPGQTVAVIGPNADRIMLGGYSGTSPHFTTVLEGIANRIGRECTVLYGEGCKITVGGSWNDDKVVFPEPESDKQSIADAIDIARKADVVILVLGENEQTSRESWSRVHLGDRVSLDLIGNQESLVRQVIATGKPVVAVLLHGRPNSIAVLADSVPAILECWYLGQECGTAVAGALFGDDVPGGKCPISFPRSAGHIPVFYNHKPSARRGYLDGDASALFPFGFGLSYTTFRIENVRLECSTIRVDGATNVMADVTNTGTKDADEVVQMYIRDLVSSVTRPVKELKGFVRVHLRSGETCSVNFPVGPEQLAFTNIHKRWVVEPGRFDVMVGNSSRDEDLTSVTLTVT